MWDLLRLSCGVYISSAKMPPPGDGWARLESSKKHVAEVGNTTGEEFFFIRAGASLTNGHIVLSRPILDMSICTRVQQGFSGLLQDRRWCGCIRRFRSSLRPLKRSTTDGRIASTVVRLCTTKSSVGNGPWGSHYRAVKLCVADWVPIL